MNDNSNDDIAQKLDAILAKLDEIIALMNKAEEKKPVPRE